MSIYHASTIEPWRCYQISDCHLLADKDAFYQGIQPYWHLQRLLSTLSPLPLIFTGDLTQDHSAQSYELLQQLLQDWPAPVFYVPGNHDDPEMMARIFAHPPFVAADEIWCASWQLLLLNTKGETPAGDLSASRLQALTERLALEPLRTAWIFCHHHPKPIGSSIDAHGLVQSTEFCQLLDQHTKVRGVAHGHCHHAYTASHGHWQIVGCPASSVQFHQAPEWLTFDGGPQACHWQFSPSHQVTWEFVVV